MSTADPGPYQEAFITDEDLLPDLPDRKPALLTDDELLDHLERIARAEAVPPCRVCGGKLAVIAIGGAKPTVWTCPAARAPEDGYLKWSERLALRAHYNVSQWHQHPEENNHVRELVERFRKLQAQPPV